MVTGAEPFATPPATRAKFTCDGVALIEMVSPSVAFGRTCKPATRIGIWPWTLTANSAHTPESLKKARNIVVPIPIGQFAESESPLLLFPRSIPVLGISRIVPKKKVITVRSWAGISLSRSSPMKLRVLTFALLALCLVGATSSDAQILSNTPSITLNATLAESLTIAATPSTVSFTLVAGGTANASAPVAITTTWVLAQGRANVVLDAYFASATAALSSGAPVSNIPSSAVYGLVSTGTPTSYTAFTQTAALGTASAGLTLFTQALTASNRNANRTDNLALQINLTSLPQLPAASYTGSLILAAQAL